MKGLTRERWSWPGRDAPAGIGREIRASVRGNGVGTGGQDHRSFGVRTTRVILNAAVALGAALAVAVPPASVFAQRAWDGEYLHRHWGVEDGLPVNAIRDLVQTDDGFLWLATVEGLVRFDGQEFTVFNAGNSEGFPQNRLLHLALAPDGTIIIELEGSHELLARHPDGRFGPFVLDGEEVVGRVVDREQGVRAPAEDAIVSLNYDSHGTQHLLRLHRGGYEKIALPRGLSIGPGNPVWVWVTDGPNVFLHPEHGVLRARGDDFEPVATTDGREISPDKWFVDSEDVLWVLTWNREVYRLEAGQLLRQSVVFPSEFVDQGYVWQCFIREPAGSFLVGRMGRDRSSNRSLHRYADGVMTELLAEPMLQCGWSELTDRQGNQWVLPGLFRNGEKVLEESNAILEGSSGAVWVANDRGLHQYQVPDVRMHTGLGNDNIYTVTEDAHGRMWTAAWDGTSVFVRVNGRWQERPAAEHHNVGLATRDGRLFLNKIYATTRPFELPGASDWQDVGIADVGGPKRLLFEDTSGHVWIGLPGPVLWRIGESGPEQVHTGAEFRTADETTEGDIWFGSARRGIARYRAGEVVFYGREFGMASNVIRWILSDPDVPNRLWVATEDNGLNRVDVGADSGGPENIVHFTEENGLFRNGLHAVLQDDFGRLWMNTNYGVFWVWKEDLNAVAEGTLSRVEPTVYTEREGLANREGNGGSSGAGLKASDGHIWFPTQGGLAEFDPARISERPPPRASILAVTADGVPVGPVLKPSERDFSVQFTAPEFTAPERLLFDYRLRGYEDVWRTTPSRSVSFTNLDPGNYTFEVRSRTRGDLAPVAILALVIRPFWFETVWFRSLMAMGLIGLVFGATRYSLNRARDRERELNEMVSARTIELQIEKETTERQATELRELNRAKSRFFANVSHEFRTPLTLIVGPLRQLLAKENHPDREAHTMMMRNADKLLGMVNRILELAKLESKTLPYDPTPGDLTARVRETTQGMVAMAERRGITLVMRDAQPCFALFDRALMDRVVTNLLSNALKFTDSGGQVTAAVEASADSATIVVRDTGIGIPEDKLQVIFDRFYQADTSSTRRYEGTGIGLSLVRELVELHGGNVTVESREGHGSTFQVHLPLVPEEVGPVLPTVVPDSEGDGLAGSAQVEAVTIPVLEDEDRTTVLLVDDNSDIRTFLRSALAEDFRVIEAFDGQDALEQVQGGLLPDVVVCDIMMPRMDGLEFNLALKNEGETELIPFVFLTALADEEHRLEGALSDADLYLTKPLDPVLLSQHIKGILRRRGRLRELLATSPPEDPEPEWGPFEARLRAEVHSRLTEPDLSAQDLADVVGLSYSQMHRRLKAEAGMTPTELVRQVRLEHALALLKRENCTISEAAYAVGFNSLSYFNRCFKAVYGVSPTAFLEGT